MLVEVKYHALQQYYNRTFTHNLVDDKAAEQFLKTIALRGVREKKLPANNNQTFAVVFQGHAVVARFYDNKITIITYLGNKTYQKWFKKSGKRRSA